MKSVKFITLGCKVNQYETQAMREGLAASGVKESASSEVMDFVVINTCTVTESADKENFYWIRRARREYPKAKIIVTGCFVERNRSELESHPEVDLVLGNTEKPDIQTYLTEGCASEESQRELIRRERKRNYIPLSISAVQEGRTRAFLKIQDGCNHACSFCKVVMVRGRSRSRSLQEVVEEAERLTRSGYHEIVLTGIQLGAYGDDLKGGVNLAEAVKACASIPSVRRIRLSSIEPTDITNELIQSMKHTEKFCPHLHIPLQSGDDEILERMNRRYNRDFYRYLIQELKNEWPDFSLTLDVMAGFAGETETQFQNTVQLIQEIEPLKCHIFPYSRREGTQAARLGNDLPPELIRSRVQQLIAVAKNVATEVQRPYIGRTVPVLVEQKRGRGDLLQGITDNYLRVCFQGEKALMGQMVPVQLLALEGSLFFGKAVLENPL